MQIENITAFVTGAGSGLGAATARSLARNGGNVAVFDFDAAKARAVADEIGGLAVNGDVRDENQVAIALRAATERFDAPRILVNCAGIGNPGKVIGKNGPLSLQSFAQVIEVNLTGTFNVIRLFVAACAELPPLSDSERGVIVNTASIAAYEGQVGQVAYSASKGGVVAMTLPLARELARVGIRVNTIAPGIFETPLLATLPEPVQKSLADSIPFPRRLGAADEFARLVLDICENAMLNGETIRIDGALRMSAA